MQLQRCRALPVAVGACQDGSNGTCWRTVHTVFRLSVLCQVLAGSNRLRCARLSDLMACYAAPLVDGS